MAGIARLGDILGPGGILIGPVSGDVFVNGRPVALEFCAYTPHPCCGLKGCPPAHCFGPTFAFPAGVTVNGVPPILKGSKGLCAHSVMTASSDVVVAGGGGLGGLAGGLAGGQALKALV